MKIKTLTFKTDFYFVEKVIEAEEYIVAQTPSNPYYFWGNFILFEKAPTKGDYEKWSNIFKKEFLNNKSEHLCFAWDEASGAVGEIDRFLENGFQLDKFVGMVCHRPLIPIHMNNALEIRTLKNDHDWAAALENQILTRPEGHSEEKYHIYKTAQMTKYRNLISQGFGQWFGAFIGEKLVGDLGIFVRDGLARFQMVGTNPDYRRQGVCATLVYLSSLIALHEMGAKSLVMVAAEGENAAKIYSSVGFIASEKIRGMLWWPKIKNV